MARPLIGVTGPDRWFAWAWWATRFAIFRAGGDPVRMTPEKNGHLVDRLGGVVIGGGVDIDPALYGNSLHAPKNQARDRFELGVLDRVVPRGIPVLGICRGAQLINVHAGGTLHDDITDLRRVTSNRGSIFAVKTAHIESSSVLAESLGATAVRVNSLHHQAVDRLGDRLAISARDEDAIVQGIESTESRFLVGVQWHPEYLSYRERHQALFRRLVSAAEEGGR